MRPLPYAFMIKGRRHPHHVTLDTYLARTLSNRFYKSHKLCTIRRNASSIYMYVSSNFNVNNWRAITTHSTMIGHSHRNLIECFPQTGFVENIKNICIGPKPTERNYTCGIVHVPMCNWGLDASFLPIVHHVTSLEGSV